jgi:hypothetical protein
MAEASVIQVALVEDQPKVREGLRTLIDGSAIPNIRAEQTRAGSRFGSPVPRFPGRLGSACQRRTGHSRIVSMTIIKQIGAFGLFLSIAVCRGQTTLVVQGVGIRSVTLSAADLSNLPQQTVKTTDHGTPATFEGVLLTDVLAKVDLPLGEKFHHTVASYYLVVEAKDGYRAVFAWAELDSTFMDKSAYVVTKRDGKPLSDKDGPFQLVVPGEKRGARWVRQVTALKIRQAN